MEASIGVWLGRAVRLASRGGGLSREDRRGTGDAAVGGSARSIAMRSLPLAGSRNTHRRGWLSLSVTRGARRPGEAPVSSRQTGGPTRRAYSVASRLHLFAKAEGEQQRQRRELRASTEAAEAPGLTAAPGPASSAPMYEDVEIDDGPSGKFQAALGAQSTHTLPAPCGSLEAQLSRSRRWRGPSARGAAAPASFFLPHTAEICPDHLSLLDCTTVSQGANGSTTWISLRHTQGRAGS